MKQIYTKAVTKIARAMLKVSSCHGKQPDGCH